MKKRLLTAWIIACMFICLVGQTPITALADGDDTRVISVPEGLQNVLINETPETQTAETEIIKEESTDVQTQQNGENNDVQSGQGEATGETDAQNQTVGEDETSATQNEVIDETNDASTDQNETATEIPAQNQPAQGENVIAETVECVEQSVEALLPEGTHNHGDIVRVSGLLPKDAIVEAIPVDVEIEGQIVLLAYDITIYENEDKKNAGICWQPEEGGLNVEFISSALEESEEEVNIWHMEDSKQDPEYVTAAPSSDDSVEFTAESFSVYVVTETKLTATIIASDGNTYEINVTYDNKSGIPMEETALKVDELKPGDDGYDEYIEESASKVGAKAEELEFSKVFDIKIVDENDENTVYEPTGNVDVSIRVIGVSLSEYPQINVLHFVEQRNAESYVVYDVTSTVKEEVVEFTTDSFSVYVVIGHEGGEVVNPRVEFHFISPYFGESLIDSNNSTAYYAVDPYEFKNKHNEQQTTQILKNGEKLELINDPGNSSEVFFYGWYIVNPYTCSETDTYGVGTDGKLYYTWPANPDRVPFESSINIAESSVNIGDTANWSMGDISGSGIIDGDGNLHVFLAPVYEKYNFVNFMLYSRDSLVNNLMTRKLIAVGSADTVEVKISDVRSNSKDSVHLLFAGWEYYNGTEWVKVPTVDHFGEEIKDPGKDGVYLSASLSDTSSIDLYPLFVEARWIDFVSGLSGSGATFVGSRYLEAWGAATTNQTPEVEGENIYSSLDVSARAGYDFDGWYAFAKLDQTTGQITNLTNPEDVTVTYIDSDYNLNTVTINTTAIQITDSAGNVTYNGTFSLPISATESVNLFSAADGKLKLYEALDRLSLTAGWTSSATKITIVYWTENALDDEYSASAARTVSTADLCDGAYYSDNMNRDIRSGSEITLDMLKEYLDKDYNVSVASNEILDDVGAVEKKTDLTAATAREEIFYDLNETLSDASQTVAGDGSTIFNMYFSRKVFKLVFHIGRDGYVKGSGNQKTTNGWNPYGNWIQFMFNDTPLTNLLGRNGSGQSISGLYSMTYNPTGETATSEYVTNLNNIMGDYVPEDDENLYVIEAKYGAYIGDKWPNPVNPDFTFTNPSGSSYCMYIWAAYYGSLYCRIANERSTVGNAMGANPDINGVYSYMSAELCSDRTGNNIINDNQVHHLVAWFGSATNADRFKQYHILYEAVDGTYDESSPTIVTHDGSEYLDYSLTTWSGEHTAGDKSEIIGKTFYEDSATSPTLVLSNLQPQFQMGWEFDGYEYVYSCYDSVKRQNPDIANQKDYHAYFFYRPKQYNLTFMYENEADRKTDTYYYKQPLSEANIYDDPEKEGYEFLGWYTNEAGVGEPFDFENETMPSRNLVLYPVLKKLDYIIRIDPNGAEIDHWRTESQTGGASTGFRADYKETISSYDFLTREFIPTDSAEIESLGLTEDKVYYYYKTRYRSVAEDGRYIPSALRDALYLTASQIDEYWTHYQSVPESSFTSRGAHKYGPTEKDDWMDAYFGGHDLSTLQKYRKTRGAEHYTFMGWYQVTDGKVSSVPFNFNTLVTDDIEIRAMWRLDGGYYLLYNPEYYATDENNETVRILGNIQQWTDPQNPSVQVYADQSHTQILRAPTNVPSGWVFRGWRVVKANGTGQYSDSEGTHNYTIWEPIQLDENGDSIYYQPGDNFVVDSQYVSENPDGGAGAIIHIQAYYEQEETSYRRPDITNLILDANDGYLGYISNLHNVQLPELSGPGHQIINETSELYNGNPTQILIGDLQSNLALHLYRYATTKTYNSVQGTNFFSHTNGYLLIGFDENDDPMDPTTGKAYIPAFAADSVASVTRNETNKILYAMWEPMVYATFVNTTDEDLIIDLSGTGGTISVVNEVTGEFDRESATTQIIVPAKSGTENGEVKVVLPQATPGTDSITATATNKHIGYKLSVNGIFKEQDPYGTGSTKVRYGDDSTYTGLLQTDATGIVVTYTEEEDPIVIYDINGGEWQETESSFVQSEFDQDIYTIKEEDIVALNRYKPEEPTRNGKLFIGWTLNADIAAQTDFSSETAVTIGSTTITPDSGQIVLDKIKSDYLWDFAQEPPYNQTLYAVWSDAVTVTFDIVKNGSNLHTWNGPDTVDTDKPYVFYRDSSSSGTIKYKMAKGEIVPKPENSTAAQNGWFFVKWILNNTDYRNTTKAPNDSGIAANAFNFTSRIKNNITLSTSWTTMEPQIYTFTIKNEVIGGAANQEFDYTIEVLNEKADKGNKLTDVNDPWGSATTKLKNGESYVVRMTVNKINANNGSYGGVIEVIDRNGNVIKSEEFIRLSTLNTKYYTTSYQLDLRISQAEQSGFVTSVSVENNINDVNCSSENSSRSFNFSIRQGKHYTGSEINPFSAGADNSLTVVFSNEGAALVAPTSYKTNYRPFFMMFGFGAILVGLIVPPVLMFRRRRDEEE